MKSALAVMLVFIHGIAQGQVAERDIHEIGVSVPIIYNHSEGTFYQLGGPRYPHGQATSYGIAIQYSKAIAAEVYAVAGIGVFKQVFGIRRPFNFTSFTQPIFYTQSYKYDNLHLYAGAGYRKQVSENFFVTVKALYHSLNSFRQKYSLDRRNYQVNKKRMYIGRFVTAGVGIERMASARVSVGLDVLVPLMVRWQDDTMFFEYNNGAGDAQQIARNKFSLGIGVLVKYHL